MRPMTNKYRGKCNGCLNMVEPGAGRYEVLGGRYSRDTRIRCVPCVDAGRENGPKSLPMGLHADLGTLLSSDPMDFVIFHNGEWKVALSFEWMATMIAMAKDQYRRA